MTQHQSCSIERRFNLNKRGISNMFKEIFSAIFPLTCPTHQSYQHFFSEFDLALEGGELWNDCPSCPQHPNCNRSASACESGCGIVCATSGFKCSAICSARGCAGSSRREYGLTQSIDQHSARFRWKLDQLSQHHWNSRWSQLGLARRGNLHLPFGDQNLCGLQYHHWGLFGHGFHEPRWLGKFCN